MKSANIEDIRYKSFPKCGVYALIGWLPNLNVRLDYGDEQTERTTRDTLATRLGWDPQYPAIAEVANESEVEQILARRKAQHELLKSLVGDNLTDEMKKMRDKDVPIQRDGQVFRVKGLTYAMARLAAFEYLYCTKGGGYKKPLCIGTSGNRRGSMLVDAAAVQLINARLDAGDEKLQPGDAAIEGAVTDHISVIVPDTHDNRFPDVAVRKQAQIRENHTKVAGFKPMTEAEDLRAFLDLVENYGKGQSDIRHAVGTSKSTYGVQIYFACVIDIYCRIKAADTSLSREERAEWKAIRLVERMTAPKYKTDADKEASRVNPDWLDFKAFAQKAYQGDGTNEAKWPPMGLMCETDAKFDRENRRRAGLKEVKAPISRPTPEVIRNWITEIQSGGGPKTSPSLKRETIQGHADRHANPFVRDAMRAVDKNNDEFLTVAKARADMAAYTYGVSDEAYAKMASVAILMGELDDDIQIGLWQQMLEAVSKVVGSGETDADGDASAEA